MVSRSYINFDLSIERDGDNYRAHVLQSCAGEGSVEFGLPFSALELEVFNLKMGHAPRGTDRRVRGSDNPELAAAKEFGAKLFGAVFQGDIYACLRASLEEAQRHEQGVRVLLRLPPELTNLPWEYLYNPAWNQFFSLSIDTPLVRYLELTPPVRPLLVKPPLRLLVVISSPSDYEPLNVEREWRDLQDALQPLVARGLVEIKRLESASLLALQRQLRRNVYHIFHFIGHGIFDERKQDSVLLFTDEQGRGRPLSGQDLGTLLRDHNSLRLAILNACEGARTGKDDPFAGAAHSLVQMGLPAVIAMQYEISDSAAILFAQEFYAALADGYGVDAALSDARKAIFASGGSVEWGTPALFSRTLDGRIFDLAPVSTQGPPPPPAPRPSQSMLASELARLYEDGLVAAQLGDWARARDIFQMVVKARPTYRDAANRLSQARQQLDLAQRDPQAQKLPVGGTGTVEIIAGLYGDALQAMEDQRWGKAQQLLLQIQKIQPGYRDTVRLLEKTGTEMSRQKPDGRDRFPWLFSNWRTGVLSVLTLIGLGSIIFVLLNNLRLPSMIPITVGSTPSMTSGVTPVITTPIFSPSVTSTITPVLTLTTIPTMSIRMVVIPAGPFQMGGNQSNRERPIHTVTLSAFRMDVYEVTNANYAKCVTDGKCQSPTNKSSNTRIDYYENKQYANYPVLNVSWNEADIYCKWRGARLPTEAEWEKAARGGLESKLYLWGDTVPMCTLGATNGAQFNGCAMKDTVAVGSFAPNEYGLFDMTGNVWEWVQDWYDINYYSSSPGIDPLGPANGDLKVLRGGSWHFDLGYLRVADRYGYYPTAPYYDVGFRCVATLKSPE